MLDRIVRWADERIPLTTIIRQGLDEEIPGGARFAYTRGSATMTAFVIQMITGVWQLFYYVPTVDHAYDSLNYLRTEVPFGWLIHGLHYWGANAIIVLVGLHIARVFLYGAYKPPRELTWLAGVTLLLVTAALVFTGAPLPWDERGYWAAVVGTSIAGTVPLVGDVVKRLLRGGDLMGQLALSRMFVLHVAILPAVLLAFLAIHLAAFRRFGSVGPWDEAKRQRNGLFWPDQVLKDAIVATFLLVFLIALCAYAPPPFAGPADPLDTSYMPKPEWNFLFLYEALKLFPGRLEPLGTVGVPLIGILVLVTVPFLGRSPERNPIRRPFPMAGGAIWVGAVIALTIIGFTSHPEGAGKTTIPPPSGSLASLSGRARDGTAAGPDRRLSAELGGGGFSQRGEGNRSASRPGSAGPCALPPAITRFPAFCASSFLQAFRRHPRARASPPRLVSRTAGTGSLLHRERGARRRAVPPLLRLLPRPRRKGRRPQSRVGGRSDSAAQPDRPDIVQRRSADVRHQHRPDPAVRFDPERTDARKEDARIRDDEHIDARGDRRPGGLHPGTQRRGPGASSPSGDTAEDVFLSHDGRARLDRGVARRTLGADSGKGR